MKFCFTAMPLKDLRIGTVVDGYKLTSRSRTGANAIGYRVDSKGEPVLPFDEVLLVYADGKSIAEVTKGGV